MCHSRSVASDDFGRENGQEFAGDCDKRPRYVASPKGKVKARHCHLAIICCDDTIWLDRRNGKVSLILAHLARR